MKKFSVTLLLTTLSLLLSACSLGKPPITSAQGTSQSGRITPGISSSSTTTPIMTVTNQLSSSCDILSSYDIASFFSYAEVEQPQHALNQVNHPAFSKQYFPVVESTCSFYAFYLPGSKNYQMLQVTTRVDLPENEPAVNWNQLWDNAISQANQIVPGLGDGAFYSNGSLTFKNGNAVVTLSISTVNLQVDPGPDQALEIETRLAQAALTHWRN